MCQACDAGMQEEFVMVRQRGARSRTGQNVNVRGGTGRGAQREGCAVGCSGSSLDCRCLPVCPRASCLPSLSFSFFICKTKVVVHQSHQLVVWVSEIMHTCALHILNCSVTFTVIIIIVVVRANYWVMRQEMFKLLRESSWGPGLLVRESFLEERRVTLGF